MNGVLFDRPALWGKSWSLYRRQTGTDSLGDPTAVYPDEPDYTAQAGTEGAVAWQQSSGEATIREPGEQTPATRKPLISQEIGGFSYFLEIFNF